ncbi:hypothetical protein J1N35_011715 [Gossypium stocksii]|uniref:Uncharacterized protein n=1 Tax=Gossypium stocksii TaxID=47602 RepID=A0A9D3W390_9ROSI|nr:hypothetical protein J1N35_011715 [Gossypium stocksii]
MLAERKSRRGKRDFRANEDAKLEKNPLGSRFAPLMVDGISGGDIIGADGGLTEEGNSQVIVGNLLNETRVSSKGESGHSSSLGHEVEGNLGKSVRPILGQKNSGPSLVGQNILKNNNFSKAQGKGPMREEESI